MKIVKYRRAREGRTNYAKRRGLLKSGTPKFVVRKTNKYVILQLVKSHEAQDSVVFSVNSKQLLEYGWPSSAKGSLKSLPAAYLAGFLLGKKILAGKIKEAVLDIGLHQSTAGSRIYATVLGAIEAGLNIKCEKEMLPTEQRIHARHMKKEIPLEDIKKKIEEREK